MTKFKELKLKKEAELKKDLAAMQEKIRELSFKHHAGELKNPKEIGKLKQDIARILTLLSQSK